MKKQVLETVKYDSLREGDRFFARGRIYEIVFCLSLGGQMALNLRESSRSVRVYGSFESCDEVQKFIWREK